MSKQRDFTIDYEEREEGPRLAVLHGFEVHTEEDNEFAIGKMICGGLRGSTTRVHDLHIGLCSKHKRPEADA